jgi:hypothetical protein
MLIIMLGSSGIEYTAYLHELEPEKKGIPMVTSGRSGLCTKLHPVW